PARVPGLRALQRDGGTDTAAEQDEYGGTYGLADENVGAGHPRLLCPSSRGERITGPAGVPRPRWVSTKRGQPTCKGLTGPWHCHTLTLIAVRRSTMPTVERQCFPRVKEASRVLWCTTRCATGSLPAGPGRPGRGGAGRGPARSGRGCVAP